MRDHYHQLSKQQVRWCTICHHDMPHALTQNRRSDVSRWRHINPLKVTVRQIHSTKKRPWKLAKEVCCIVEHLSVSGGRREQRSQKRWGWQRGSGVVQTDVPPLVLQVTFCCSSADRQSEFILIIRKLARLEESFQVHSPHFPFEGMHWATVPQTDCETLVWTFLSRRHVTADTRTPTIPQTQQLHQLPELFLHQVTVSPPCKSQFVQLSFTPREGKNKQNCSSNNSFGSPTFWTWLVQNAQV